VKNSTKMPTYHELMNPLLQALHELGGSGSIEEIAQKVAELSDLPEEILNLSHNPEKSSQTEIEYRLAWARTYLKKYGILDNSDRGIWIIVPEKRKITMVDPQEVIKTVRAEIKKQKELVQKEENGVKKMGSSLRLTLARKMGSRKMGSSLRLTLARN